MPIDRIITASIQDGAVVAADLAAGVPTRAQLPAGCILQVVQGTTTSTVTTSSGTPLDTGLTVSITPTSASSRILIMVSQQFYLYGGGTDAGALIYLQKNGSNLYSVNGHSVYIANPNQSELIFNFPITYLDSPATTSLLTYKTQVAATAGGTIQTSYNSNLATITLMEIAA